MGTITITISEKAESFLRGKNNFKGDMGRFVSELLEREAERVEAQNMDTNGEAFRKRAYDAEKTLDTMIRFLESKGLYDEYMKWKVTK